MDTEPRSPRAVSKAVRKFRCVSMVNTLARNWQKWATEHTHSQKAQPPGWSPGEAEEKVVQSRAVKQPLEVPRPKPKAALPCEEQKESTIRTIPVTKTVGSRPAAQSGELVSLMSGRFSQTLPEPAAKPFLGNRSPTRRRLCQGRAAGQGQAQGQAQAGSAAGGAEKRKEGTEEGGTEEAGAADRLKRKRVVPSLQVRTMGDLRKAWLSWAEQHMEKQKVNPFSEDFDYDYAMGLRLKKGDRGYGRPMEGSKSAERAERAQKHIRKEMEEMCYIIGDLGDPGSDGRTWVTFGRLFDRYVTVSDKVVGILMRARKHGLLDFQGEMLWKGEHDDVIITLND